MSINALTWLTDERCRQERERAFSEPPVELAPIMSCVIRSTAVGGSTLGEGMLHETALTLYYQPSMLAPWAWALPDGVY